MRVHERSIRGCGASRFTPPRDCRYTQNGTRLYCHIFGWPFRNLHLDGLAGKLEYAQLLNEASEVRFHEVTGNEKRHLPAGRTKGSIVLDLPVVKPNVNSYDPSDADNPYFAAFYSASS